MADREKIPKAKPFLCITGDIFDSQAFRDTVGDCQAFGSMIGQAEKTFPTVLDLAEDTFRTLYKPVPEFKDAVPVSHILNAAILKILPETEDWQLLRNYTRYDAESSILGAYDLMENVVDNLPEGAAEAVENAIAAAASAAAAQSSAQNAQGAAQKAQQKAQEAPGDAQAQEDAKNASGKAQAAGNKASQAQGEADKAKKDLKDFLDDKDTKKSLKEALEQAVKDAAENLDFSAGNGWGREPGTRKPVPFKERYELARKLATNKKFRKIVEMAGRYRRFALSAQRKKVVHGADEIIDVETGNELSRVLPIEVAHLRHPVLAKEFYRRFAEGGLNQYRLQGIETQDKGPILVAFDGSGSMSGDREVWAKAFTLGVFQIAKRQRRPFACAQFGSEDELEEWELPRGISIANEIKSVESIADFFWSGGTDFDRPLRWALEKIRHGKGFKKADLIFVSDGACMVSPEVLKEVQKAKKELGFRIIGIYVGDASDVSVRPEDETDVPESLKCFSDTAVALSSFKDDKAARDVAYSI